MNEEDEDLEAVVVEIIYDRPAKHADAHGLEARAPDDGTDFQVPARAVHHAEQALVHLKLALDVARQLHLIS